MYILRHPEHCPATMKHSVIALGNFDGVHIGHRNVIATARHLAQQIQAPCTVLTFEPHPAMVLSPTPLPMRLTPFRAKAALIGALGVDMLAVIRFSRLFAAQSAEDFIRSTLVESLNVRHVVVGHDFNFGRNRSGNAAMLQETASRYGISVTCVPPVQEGGDICSSTRIRHYVREGNIQEASRLLGYGYTISGRVVAGDKRGRLLGFPTANIALSPCLLVAAHGVYAAQVSLDCGDTWLHAVANIGIRPTVGPKGAVSLEVHIFDFDNDIYGKRAEVRLLHHLRPEQRFDSLEALQKQIAMDAKQAQTVLLERNVL